MLNNHANIAVIIDSNMLYCNCKDFTRICFIDNLEKYIDLIEASELYDCAIILLPQMVVDELLKQQLEQYEEYMSTYRTLIFPDTTVVYDSSYYSYLKTEYKKISLSFSNYQVEVKILPYPSNECFNNIIERAVNKDAPFEGKKGKSDKGFKDVIVWESLLEYKIHHRDEAVLFVAKDKRFHEIKSEYMNKFNEKIIICDNIDNFTNTLSEVSGENIELHTYEGEVKQTLLDNLYDTGISWMFINSNHNFYSMSYTIEDCWIIKINEIQFVNTQDIDIIEYELSLTMGFSLVTDSFDRQRLEEYIEKQIYIENVNIKDNGFDMNTTIKICVQFNTNTKQYYILRSSSIFGQTEYVQNVELFGDYEIVA